MASAARVNLELKRFADEVESDFADTMRETATSLLSQIVRRTPTDTGAARGAWTVAVNSEPAYANTLSKSDAPRQSEVVKLQVLRASPFSLVSISNNLPYINELENGSSRQAPAGMVALAVAAVRSNTL